ncbi:hypothetical protein OS493_031234 [Desmophyllum pertusum]|uniref:Uncharacterized protein n=1 Tax=Desmophyllum pertusum TaxID=174260 RepID=A0A9X0CUX6_9CNID|nr:hypothetical protein OS493_031234 [Desmophyllum pertusum]
MAEAVQWLDGQAKQYYVEEKICPEKHIRQNQWQSEWNQAYLTNRDKWTYDYISDYECIFNHPIDVDYNQSNLHEARKQGTALPITNLAHFTNHSYVYEIIETGGFTGEMKKINEDAQRDDIVAKFSWWSPIFTEEDNNQVRDTLGAAIQPFLGQCDDLANLKNQFATSDAFKPNPRRYGNRYFQYGINELCQCNYADSLLDDLQYKIMGTFGYKQEIMHAVLVCSQANGAGRFRAYPPVLTPEEDANNEAVVTRDNHGNWTWKPQATGTEIRRLDGRRPYPMYRRWENVAFAFHIPDAEEAKITVNDLISHLHQL